MPVATQKRILVVEDEPKVATILKTRLEKSGFTAEIAQNGKSALSLVAEHCPDLVILDLRLPDMNGYEVAKAIRQLHNPWILPLLMLTGMDRPVDQLRGFAYGADAYLTKPFEMNELIETVTSLLNTS